MSQWFKRVITHSWTIVGVAVLILILLEAIARAGIAFYQRDQPAIEPALIDTSPGADDLARRTFTREYSREFVDSTRLEWRSHVYWRSRPYRGKYINIDEKGLRRTWNSTPYSSPNQLKVFVFGGSTTWGMGARDEFTIPSLVSKQLSRRLPAGVWVTNFGQMGYVSTQEVIALMLELQRGNVPDLAVFYDGVNEVYSVVQSGVVGIPLNERNRVAEFNLRWQLNWRGFVETLALYRLNRAIIIWLAGKRFGGYLLTDELADALVDVHLGNVGIVDALASRYGFQAVFFWQPTVFTKRHLSQREKGLLLQAAPSFRLVNEVYQDRIRMRRIDGVHDLTGVFDDDVETVFIDPFHVSEGGNVKIADAMARILVEVIGMRRK